MSEAEVAVGVDHFNWLQRATVPGWEVWVLRNIDPSQIDPSITSENPVNVLDKDGRFTYKDGTLIDAIPDGGVTFDDPVVTGSEFDDPLTAYTRAFVVSTGEGKKGFAWFSDGLFGRGGPLPDSYRYYFNEDPEPESRWSVTFRDNQTANELKYSDRPSQPVYALAPDRWVSFDTRLVGVMKSRTDFIEWVGEYTKTSFQWKSNAVHSGKGGPALIGYSQSYDTPERPPVIGGGVFAVRYDDGSLVPGSPADPPILPPLPPPNTAPVAFDIPNQSTSFGTAITVPFTVGDAESPANALVVEVSSSDESLVPRGGIVVTGTGADRTLTVTPVSGVSGTATITVTVRDPGGLTATDTFTVTVTPADPGPLPPPTSPPPPPGPGPGPVPGPLPRPGLVGFRQFVVGPDTGGWVVQIHDADPTARYTTEPLGAVPGGVRTAAADFNGDGVADFVAGTGPGLPTRVRILDGRTGVELFAVDPFEPAFTGGVYVAAADLTGDGVADLVITPDEGGGPRVRVFDGKGFGLIADFFGIDDPDFRGGARAAAGDVNGDGAADLIVAAGFQGGPRVAGFSGKSLASGNPARVFADFFAFEESLRNGVFVAAGDLDGDGFAEVIAGGGPGGGPRVTAFGGKALLDSQYVPVANFFGGDPDSRGGVRVAVKDLDGDDRADLVTGAGTGAGSRVTAYLGKNIPAVAFDFDAIPGFSGGVFVG
jgi:hypothetical protein